MMSYQPWSPYVAIREEKCTAQNNKIINKQKIGEHGAHIMLQW